MISDPSDGPHDVRLAATAYASLIASGPLPRLTWQGEVDGRPERLELSGRVLATWAAKIANLVVEEVDAGPGTRVALDLPIHWRTLVWTLGTWLTGACVVTDPGSDPEGSGTAPDVLVTASSDAAQEAVSAGVELVVLVPLASFALRVPGPLPAGVLDGAADVAAQPDALGPVRPGDPAAPALETGTSRWSGADLARGAAPGSDAASDGPEWWGARAVRGLARGDRLDLPL